MRRLRAALETKVTWDFHDKPLRELAADIAQNHAIPVLLDWRALGDQGIEQDAPISLKVDGVSLANALTLALHREYMNYLVSDGVLSITSAEFAEHRLLTRVYPVRDLAVDVAQDAIDFAALTKLIQENVWPDSWESGGGSGRITPFPPSFCVVVRQSEEAHAQLEKFLAALRNISTYAEPPLAPLADDRPAQKLRLRAYEVTAWYWPDNWPYQRDEKGGFTPNARAGPSPGLVEVAELLRQAVEPESWKTPGAFVRATADRIVVRQTAAAHNEIRKLLLELEVISPLGPFGGMCGSVIPVVGSNTKQAKGDGEAIFPFGTGLPPFGPVPAARGAIAPGGAPGLPLGGAPPTPGRPRG